MFEELELYIHNTLIKGLFAATAAAFLGGVTSGLISGYLTKSHLETLISKYESKKPS